MGWWPLRRGNVDNTRIRRGIFAQLLRYRSIGGLYSRRDEKRKTGRRETVFWQRSRNALGHSVVQTWIISMDESRRLRRVFRRPINGCLHARKGEEEKVEEFNRGRIPIWKRDRTRFNAVCLWMCIYVDGISLNRLGCKCNLETARDYVMGGDRLWKWIRVIRASRDFFSLSFIVFLSSS